MTTAKCCMLQEPKTALSIINSLIVDYEFTQREVAEMINISVYDLKQFRVLGTLLDEETQKKLFKIRDIIITWLHDTATHEGISQWFRSSLRNLDGRRPIDLLKNGEPLLVFIAASAFAESSYL